MTLIFAAFTIITGLLITLIGFKVFNPYKVKNNPETEASWYKKNGTIFKVGGIAMVVYGIIRTIRIIRNSRY